MARGPTVPLNATISLTSWLRLFALSTKILAVQKAIQGVSMVVRHSWSRGCDATRAVMWGRVCANFTPVMQVLWDERGTHHNDTTRIIVRPTA